MLLKKVTLNIDNNKMYKKCAGIFKIETLHRDYPEDCIYDNLKQIAEWKNNDKIFFPSFNYFYITILTQFKHLT